MRGDGDDPPAGEARRQRVQSGGQRGLCGDPVAHRQQCVDDGIARDVDRGAGHVFGAQGGGGLRCGGEVQVGDHPGHLAVRLFRPWGVDVAAAQPRLDMADRDLAEISGERRDHRGQRVAVDQDAIGPPRVQRRAELGEDARRQHVERLARLHQVKIDVGDDAEDRQNLVEQLAMLRGDRDADVQPVTRA